MCLLEIVDMKDFVRSLVDNRCLFIVVLIVFDRNFRNSRVNIFIFRWDMSFGDFLFCLVNV